MSKNASVAKIALVLALAGAGALALAPAAPAGSCGQSFNPVIKSRFVTGDSAKASWTLSCNGGNITMKGWVEDLREDGLCAQVRGHFSDGSVIYSNRACPDGDRDEFSWTKPGFIADGYLIVS